MNSAFEQSVRFVDGSGYRADADQGVAFPVSTVALVVVFEGIETRDQRSAAAERAQPHVHPEHDAVLGSGGERLHQLSTQPGEELFVAEGAPPFPPDAFATRRISEQQVDIGGEVEFLRAELAQRVNDETLRLASWRGGLSERLLQQSVQMPGGHHQHRVGESRGVEQRLFE